MNDSEKQKRFLSDTSNTSGTTGSRLALYAAPSFAHNNGACNYLASFNISTVAAVAAMAREPLPRHPHSHRHRFPEHSETLTFPMPSHIEELLLALKYRYGLCNGAQRAGMLVGGNSRNEYNSAVRKR